MNSIVLLTKLELQQTFGGMRGAIEKRTGANGAMAGTALIGIILLAGGPRIITVNVATRHTPAQ